MKLLKAKLKPETAFSSLLQSDTLFGEFCWHFKFLYGEEELKKLLESFDKNPSIVFSDMFPSNFLPFPALFFKENPIKEKNTDLYKSFKKFKKIRYIERDFLLNVTKKLSAQLLFDSFLKGELPYFQAINKEKKLVGTAEHIHVEIDRLTGTSKEGILYSKTYTYLNTSIDVYIAYNPKIISPDKIADVLYFMGIDGVGAEKSTGKGKFSIENIEEFTFPYPDDANGFFSLSTGVPKSDEVRESYGKFFTKFPKHGVEIYTEKESNIFKNPVILMKSGSLFKFKNVKEIYGTVFKLSKNSNHFQCAKIIPVFVRF